MLRENAADIGMEIRTKFIPEQGFALLGGKDEVNQ